MAQLKTQLSSLTFRPSKERTDQRKGNVEVVESVHRTTIGYALHKYGLSGTAERRTLVISIHPSIHLFSIFYDRLLLSSGFWGSAGAEPSGHWAKAAYTHDKLPTHRRAGKQ